MKYLVLIIFNDGTNDGDNVSSCTKTYEVNLGGGANSADVRKWFTRDSAKTAILDFVREECIGANDLVYDVYVIENGEEYGVAGGMKANEPKVMFHLKNTSQHSNELKLTLPVIAK